MADGVQERIARTLGADVPGQLRPGLSLGTGAGERLEPVAPLAPHAFVIVPQSFPLATAEVYREADRLGLPRGADELAERRRALATAMTPGAILPEQIVVNDLEPASVSLAPGIAEALGDVRAVGAEHTLVCGSGPTVIGIYWGEQAESRAREGLGRLGGKYPEAVFATPLLPSQ
jgi:4-diphosphocytidyl-2-C-methyl-D-erythritol kinase